MDGDPVCVAALAARGFDVRHGDLRERLPFHDGQFRFVIAHDVLEHFSLPDAKAITAEVHRILKPGGTFVVLVPNRKGFDFGLRTGAGHVTYVTRREIDEISAGSFELERAYPEPLPRWLGSRFAHNKEVFLLRKSARS
jgi:SAM-dependent methyltransferase